MLDYCIFKKVVFLFCLVCLSATSQEKAYNKITSNFELYNEQYREVAYSQLNKNIYVKGEMLGFSSFITNKVTKQPSILTNNLYCVITDANNNIVKSKLLKVEKGFTNNTFNIDSLFTTGEYTFKAYTNWMKNFDEPNAFVEKFRVIDTEQETIVKAKEISNVLDAQFLPEGGHFIDGVKTNVGVVIKNSEGLGVKHVSGYVFDSKDNYITSFQTNTLGLGKFLLYPKLNEQYNIKITYLNTNFKFNIKNVEPKGITIHVNRSRQKLALEFLTNENTLKDIIGKPFKIVVHNGTRKQLIDLKISSKHTTVLMDYENLFSGINIFTLFDDKDTPILERLFFNHKDIGKIEFDTPKFEQIGDSTKIHLSLKRPFTSAKDSINLSISVLPEATKSYNRHHNIISYNYLQPYVNGFVENASYYFTNTDRKKEYELDLLLITQGWSSYDWNTIFNHKPLKVYEFEDGITIKTNKNNNETESFLIYPSKFGAGEIIDFKESERVISRRGFYPIADETLNISAIKKNGKTDIASTYVQFSPSKISNLDYGFYNQSPFKEPLIYTKVEEGLPFLSLGTDKIEELNEVVVEADVEKTRLRKLSKIPWERVHVFDDDMRGYLTLPNFINGYLQGFSAREFYGELQIVITSGPAAGRTPRVFVDDIWINVFNQDFLVGFDMATVDYFRVNRHGFGAGGPGVVGEIRIYTLKGLPPSVNKKTIRSIEFPVTFAGEKKFYTPKYMSYRDNFFEEYGVIDWIGNGNVDDMGNLGFTVYNPEKTNLNLFIEGIAQNGSYISEKKVVGTDINK